VGRRGGEEGLKRLLKEEMIVQLYPDGVRGPVGPLGWGGVREEGGVPEQRVLGWETRGGQWVGWWCHS